MQRIERDLDEVLNHIETANRRIAETRSILPMSITGTAGTDTLTGSRVATHLIPTLPSFRGDDPGAIKDPFQFLGKVRAILSAHEVPESLWFLALLTILNGYYPQWAEKNLNGLNWEETHAKFLHHFESPAIRGKLIRELMTIRQDEAESFQEYSDRFTSLMIRTGRDDDDETLVAMYIDGLDPSLQDVMHVVRVATLKMWKRTN